MHAALKSVLLVVVFGMMLANADHTITCPCFGYSIDGGSCGTSGDAFTMTSGTTETLTIDAGCASGPHPAIITTAANSLSTYSGSSGSSSGVTGASFTLTVPASTTQFDLFLTCHFHQFSKTITVLASSSGSSTGTIQSSTGSQQSSTGQHHESSSTGQQHQSSSTGIVESSSTAQQQQSSSTGIVESSSSSSSSGSESSSSSESSSESAVISGSGDCTAGTWSPTGEHPCYPCAENTYANIRATECHSCPEHTHIPSTDVADSITRCICDDGYTSVYASGGPCHLINETESSSSSSTGESSNSSSSSTGAEEAQCYSSLTGYDCDSYSYCRSVYGYKCIDEEWEFLGCVLRSSFEVNVFNTTCAKNDDGERAWFPEQIIPDDWTLINENHGLRRCCRHNNLGTTHCSFVNGSVCALAQYEGSCPSTLLLQVWREDIIEGVATVVSEQLNVSRAEATIGLDLESSNRTHHGELVCTLRAQVYPPDEGDLNGFDFLAALWDQLGGSSLLGSPKGKSVPGMHQRARRSRLLQSAPPQDKIPIPRQDIISYPSHAIATYQMNASLLILLLAVVATMWR